MHGTLCKPRCLFEQRPQLALLLGGGIQAAGTQAVSLRTMGIRMSYEQHHASVAVQERLTSQEGVAWRMLRYEWRYTYDTDHLTLTV